MVKVLIIKKSVRQKKRKREIEKIGAIILLHLGPVAIAKETCHCQGDIEGGCQ